MIYRIFFLTKFRGLFAYIVAVDGGHENDAQYSTMIYSTEDFQLDAWSHLKPCAQFVKTMH